MADEMIQIDIGGDANPFVSSVTASANANKMLVESVEKLKTSIRSQGQETKKSGEETRGYGNKVKTASKEVGGLESMTRKATASVKGMVAGYLGVQGIAKVWRLVADEIRRVIELQQKFAGNYMNTQRILKDMAIQHRIQYTPGWETKMGARLTQMQRATNLTEEQIGALEVSSKLVAGDRGAAWQTAVAEQVGLAGFGEAYTPSGISQLMGIVGKGVTAKDPKEAARQAAKMISMVTYAQTESASEEPSAFMTALQPLVALQTKMGGTPEQAMLEFIQAMKAFGRGGEMRAGELTRQVSRAVGREDMAKILSRSAGISVGQYWKMSLNDRKKLLAAWADTATEEELAAAVEPEMKTQLQLVYGGGGAAAIEEMRPVLAQQNAELFFDRTRTLRGTRGWRRASERTQADITRRAADQAMVLGTEAMRRWQTAEEAIAAGITEVEGLTPAELEHLKPMMHFGPGRTEAGVVMKQYYSTRLNQLKQEQGYVMEGRFAGYRHPGEVPAHRRIPTAMMNELTQAWGGLGSWTDTPMDYGKFLALWEQANEINERTAEASERTADQLSTKKPVYEPN